MKKTPTTPEPEYRNDYEEDDVYDETDSEQPVAPVHYEISSYGIDFDVKGLVERLRQEKVLIPEFQRSFVWRLPDSSRFIESLLLGLPVPGIFLAQEPTTKKLLVIDGQQRLRSLQFFYDGIFNPSPGSRSERPFRLIRVQAPFEGQLYEDLTERARQVLDDSVIHATIVKQDTPKDDDTSIYHVYERLNSGGRRLHPQEIRTAIFHGPLIETLREANSHEAWRALFGPPSPRLKDEEMVLRFLALYEDSESYERPMNEFLNTFAKKNRFMSVDRRTTLTKLFTRTMRVIHQAIGPKAFRPERNFNAAVFDSISYGVAKRIDGQGKTSIEPIREAYARLLMNEAFQQSTSRSTADTSFVTMRLSLAQKEFSNKGE